MAKCSNCGEEVTGSFCINCGTPAPESKVNLEKTETAEPEIVNTGEAVNKIEVVQPQNQYQNNFSGTAQANQNPTPPPVYNNIQVNMPNVTTSVGGWIGWILLISFLNIIGVLIMLCATKDESAKNFAKAYLVFFGICIAITLVIMLICILIPVMLGAASR